MADVSKVQGPTGPQEGPGKKDKASADADKFKQAMHKRVTEVSQVDPDEQKKRKRREESEEEDLGQVQTGPTTPASEVTPFSLGKGVKKASPLAMHGPGTSPMSSAPPAPPSPPSQPPLLSSSSEEMADDSGTLEQESFIENVPSSPPRMPQSTVPLGGQPVTPSAQAQQPAAAQQQQQPSQVESQQKNQQSKKAHKDKVGVASESLEGKPASKVHDTTKFFEQLGPGEKEKDKTPLEMEKSKTPLEMEKEAEMQGIGMPAQPTPLTHALKEKEEKEEKKVEESEKEGAQMQGGAPETPMMADLAPPSLEPLPSYANLSPQVMDLFDRMVGVMTVMTASGVTETTVTLNMPQFASSVFFGTQIIIQEFSTAPKAFNIQLNGTPQAVALFKGNADDLMAAFQSGNYNYRINRLDTGHLSERPLFKRKEKAAGKDNEKETGENP